MHPVTTAADQRDARAVGAGADKAAVVAAGPLRSTVDVFVSTTGPAELVVETRAARSRREFGTAAWDAFAYDTAAYTGDDPPPWRESDRVTIGSATTTLVSADAGGPVVRAYLTANHDTVELVARGL